MTAREEQFMRRVFGVMLLGVGLMASGTASAQSWGIYFGTDGGYRGDYRDFDDDDGVTRLICSGQRAHGLEQRLRREVDEDEIDSDDADRIHDAIDRLEDRQRNECSEGDRRAIYGLAGQYDRVDQWIDREAHSYDRRGW